MSKRSTPWTLRQRRDRIRRRGRNASAVDFFNVLTSPLLLEWVEEHLLEHRERLYPPTVVLSMFIKQVLEEDGSCQRAVNGWAAQRAAEGLIPQSVRTGAYCRARQRLPGDMVMALTRETGALLCAQSESGWRWRGRAVKLVDGTGISMPDTPDNQARYPQPSSQRRGVGFPHPLAHGTGGSRVGIAATRTQLQAHGANVDAVDIVASRLGIREAAKQLVPPHRPGQGRPTTRSTRTTRTKATTQTIPLAKGAARSRTPTDTIIWLLTQSLSKCHCA